MRWGGGVGRGWCECWRWRVGGGGGGADGEREGEGAGRLAAEGRRFYRVGSRVDDGRDAGVAAVAAVVVAVHDCADVARLDGGSGGARAGEEVEVGVGRGGEVDLNARPRAEGESVEPGVASASVDGSAAARPGT